jgi:dTDP-4-dehydrorhamnose 3,5-epimerase
MKITNTTLEGVLLLEPQIFQDERGFFYESFNRRNFLNQVGIDPIFVQDNHSHSTQAVLRGLHYQIKQSQGKLIRVIQGEVFDVAVDLREHSPTFGKWEGFKLLGKHQQQLWIPPGFAHGFLVLSESADLLYKVTDYYAAEFEQTLAWNDPEIDITWPEGYQVKLSAKDQAGMSLEEAKRKKMLYSF